MKILYYSPSPNLNLSDPSGYGTHMREMIHAFRELGHEVRPVIMGGQLPQKNEHPAPPFKSVFKKILPGYFWESFKDLLLLKMDKRSCKMLIAEIEDFRPDIIYERCSYLQGSGCLAAVRMGVPHILEVNAPFIEEKIYFAGNSWFLRRAKKIEQQALANAKRIAVVSSALGDFLAQEYGVSRDKIMVTPNGINFSSSEVSHKEVEGLRLRLGLNGHTVIGFVGSFFRYHGIDLLLRSFCEVSKTNKAVKLLIVGDGHILSELKQLSRELKIESNVIFTGNIPHTDIYNYIQLMDICTMARSNWYGSPVKIFEYGAMGKAIVAPDVAPVRDVMNNGEDGLLVKPDAESISEALQVLLGSPEKRGQMGSSFRKKVLQYHSWKHNAEKILL